MFMSIQNQPEQDELLEDLGRGVDRLKQQGVAIRDETTLHKVIKINMGRTSLMNALMAEFSPSRVGCHFCTGGYALLFFLLTWFTHASGCSTTSIRTWRRPRRRCGLRRGTRSGYVYMPCHATHAHGYARHKLGDGMAPQKKFRPAECSCSHDVDNTKKHTQQVREQSTVCRLYLCIAILVIILVLLLVLGFT